MHAFDYHRADSPADAAHLLARDGAMPLGGGTDLLVLLKEELARPTTLVDLRVIPGWRDVREGADGGVRIGAAVRVHELARHQVIRTRFPVLAQACESVGTPALRHMGTIGGNLNQRPRCWYFRRDIPCLKNGGDACPAATGENQYHAILGGGPCFIVHPSDPAVALTALEARVEIMGARGATRTVPIADFFVLPSQRLDRETVLRDGEVVSAIEIDAAASGGMQRYRKLMQRDTWDFALVSLAAVRRADGDVRLVLGGVAPKPWRVDSAVEEDVSSGALYDARPLAKNGYKVDLAAALLREAMASMQARG